MQLVTSDDHAGLRAAISRHFQGASWQRCQVHFARNLLGRVARKHRKHLAEDRKGIFRAPTLEWAREAVVEVVDAWRGSHRALAEHLEGHVEECLVCFAFPVSHRLRIRTTNYLVCYPFRAPECIKLNAAIFRFTLVLSDLNVFT